ncbi:hypothetical protein ACVILI_004707 [Mesorhizobium sp. USDA 4775]
MPSLSLRINLDPDGRIGPGKIELLEQIATFGSISAAARGMEMSYKHAWDLVEDMNRVFRQAAGRRADRRPQGRRRAADGYRPCGGQPFPRHRACGHRGGGDAYGCTAGGDRCGLRDVGGARFRAANAIGAGPRANQMLRSCRLHYHRNPQSRLIPARDHDW